MQFIRDGELYKVVSVTGPTHNFLGIMFGGQDGEAVEVDIMDIKPSEPKRLVPDEVEEQVLAGVEEANGELGIGYRVKRIQFVPSDTPPVKIYRELAKQIVERLARGEPFMSTGN